MEVGPFPVLLQNELQRAGQLGGDALKDLALLPSLQPLASSMSGTLSAIRQSVPPPTWIQGAIHPASTVCITPFFTWTRRRPPSKGLHLRRKKPKRSKLYFNKGAPHIFPNSSQLLAVGQHFRWRWKKVSHASGCLLFPHVIQKRWPLAAVRDFHTTYYTIHYSQSQRKTWAPVSNPVIKLSTFTLCL